MSRFVRLFRLTRWSAWLFDIGVICLLIYLANLFWFYGHATKKKSPDHPAPASLAQGPTQPLPGESILKNYAQPFTKPEEDLSMMAHAFSNLLLLVKGDSPFRMGANEEFAAALCGKNKDSLRFLPDRHACLNAQGQLIDRWGSALFFHVNGSTRIDIRSAGPDRQMWTPDDLHRIYTGEMHRGAELPLFKPPPS